MNKNKKISIIVPTFNDADFISQMIESVKKQDYANWELIISDDASTDSTEQIVSFYLSDKRIKYIKNLENKDQQNAILSILDYITGDIITLMHSDDLLYNGQSLARINESFKEDEDIDGVYSDLVKIDKYGNVFGFVKTPKYVDKKTIYSAYLNRGGNIVTDVFCVKRKIFFERVLNNYLKWNTLYWLNFDKNDFHPLKLKKISSWYKYRIYDNNYLSQGTASKFVFLNGCYRTITELSYFLNVKRINVFLFLNKIPKIRRINNPIFFISDKTKNEYNYNRIKESIKQSKYLLKNMFLSTIKNDDEIIKPFFEAPIKFIENFDENSYIFELSNKLNSNKQYLGKDARIFFKDSFLNKQLPALYFDLIQKASILKAVYVQNQEEVIKARDVLRFLCLPVPILIGEERIDRDEDIQKGFERRFDWE